MIALLVSDDRLFPAGTLRELAALGPVQRHLAGARVCLTGWDTPPLTDAELDTAPDLRLIAHTGGSVRALVPESAYDRGIRITHASAVLAEAVAEFTVMQILCGLRDAVGVAGRMRAGDGWESMRVPGRLLRDQTVGIIGASRVGRATLTRLLPFGCALLLSDPLVRPDEAVALGARLVELPELLDESTVVSLHAPLLPATRGMLGAAELARLRQGAILVNTARAGLTDETALLAAVRAGRITVLLDVFHHEPLPADSPWRTTQAVVATPHIAALTAETLWEQGSAMVAEIRRYLTGEPLRHEIPRSTYHTIA